MKLKGVPISKIFMCFFEAFLNEQYDWIEPAKYPHQFGQYNIQAVLLAKVVFFMRDDRLFLMLL